MTLRKYTTSEGPIKIESDQTDDELAATGMNKEELDRFRKGLDALSEAAFVPAPEPESEES